jgi:hypothetical protein
MKPDVVIVRLQPRVHPNMTGLLLSFTHFLVLLLVSDCFPSLVGATDDSKCLDVRRIGNYKFKVHMNGQYDSFILNQKSTFEVELSGLPNDYHEPNSTAIHGRVIGDSIIGNVRMILMDNQAYRWTGNFIIVDQESPSVPSISSYRLQLRISWLRGSLLDSILPLKGDTAEKFIGYSDYIDEIIYDGPLVRKENPVAANGVGVNVDALLPEKQSFCAGGNLPGRWKRTENGEDPNQYLNDRFGFNHNRIWRPYDCRYKIYSRQEVRSCFKRVSV